GGGGLGAGVVGDAADEQVSFGYSVGAPVGDGGELTDVIAIVVPGFVLPGLTVVGQRGDALAGVDRPHRERLGAGGAAIAAPRRRGHAAHGLRLPVDVARSPAARRGGRRRKGGRAFAVEFDGGIEDFLRDSPD